MSYDVEKARARDARRFEAIDKKADPDDPFDAFRLQVGAIILGFVERVGCCPRCVARVRAHTE